MDNNTNGERRTHTIDNVLISIGEVKQISDYTHNEVRDLVVKVGIQNGRVTKLENWHTFMRGAISILVLLILPIAISVFSSWLKLKFQS